MQLTKLLYSALLSFTTTAAASKAPPPPPTTGTGTTVTLAIPASPHLPNPLHQLSGHRTRATLSRLGAAYEAPLSGPLPPPSSSPNTNTNAAFLVFHNVTPGSYIADVHSASHGFAPLRVDVVVADETAPKVRVWETFRGNEWENKGEEVRGLATGTGAGAAAAFPVRVLGAKAYFVERGSCEFFFQKPFPFSHPTSPPTEDSGRSSSVFPPSVCLGCSRGQPCLSTGAYRREEGSQERNHLLYFVCSILADPTRDLFFL